MSTNEFDCFSAEDFKEGLGKLDDTMIRYVLLRKLVFFLSFFFKFFFITYRLLSDNNPMDQQLADPATEEHLKNV